MATLTSPGLICPGERATFSCTNLANILIWRYNNIQVGDILKPEPSTPATTMFTVGITMFTLTPISTANGMLVSNLSFIADIMNNGSQITCIGQGEGEHATIQVGSGKDHQPCTRT